jgi:hypothetical protein
MATATLSPAPKLQFFDANGNPLVGGKLYSYAAGTSTPLATYTGNTTTTANSNPVVLDSRGEAGVWLSSSYYKLKLTDSNNVEIWTVDNVGGFATMADLTAAIAALTASLASSSGSSMIGFIQAGTSAVATTAQTKMRETISVKDFGAVGDDTHDDTTNIQAAINYANTIGGDVYFPPGIYKITNGLTINNSGDILDVYKASMYGDSSSSARIHGMAGSYDMLTITGGSASTAGVESHQVIRGLFFVKEDYVGFCIGGDNLAFLSLEDVSCFNGAYSFYATDVLSSVFYNCVFRQATIGMRAEYGGGVGSYPNALTMVGCVIGNCRDAGVWIVGGTTFNMFGGSVESNGIDGSSATKFGVLLNNSGFQGSVSGNFSGVYFENNVGTADIWLANSAQPAAASISGCSFARISSSYYVTNNILVETSGAGVTQSVSVAGCGFKYFNTYVPNSGRKYINAISTSSGVSTVAWSGCTFQSATETPTITNEIQLTGGGGGYVTAVTGTSPIASSGGTTPAISIAASSGSTNGYLSSTDWNTFNGKASTAFPGWNSVTFQNSWSDAGYPSPLCSYYKDPFGTVWLQGGAIHSGNSTATIFTLPSGYRPASTLVILVYGEASSTATISVITITTAGAVSMLPSGNVVSLNNVSFQTN